MTPGLIAVIVTIGMLAAWVVWRRRRGTPNWDTASRTMRFLIAFMAACLVGWVLTSLAAGSLRNSYPTILFAAGGWGLTIRFYCLMSNINNRRS